MKIKIISTIMCFTLLTTFGLTACNYLDIVPDDVVTENSKWVDRQTAERSLATVYKSLPPMGDYNGNPAFLGAGEMVLPNLTQWENQAAMRLFLRTHSSAVTLFDYWQGEWGGYSGMRQCNDFLAGVGGVRDLDVKERNRMIAEVKTIKAYEMFYMLRQYGPICPIRENTPVEQGTAANKVYREPVDSTFSYIIQLLDEAISSKALPTIITDRTTQLGRFTEAAVRFLKARVLLYWASPLFNGNTDYAEFVDQNGHPFFNRTYDPSRWRRAAEACDSAIIACRESGVKLYTANEYKTYPDMRYSDLLLMAAEAWNEVEGPSQRVVGYLNQVRHRAGLEGIAESYEKYAKPAYRNYYTTQANMRSIIHRERAIELAFEGKNYWDELRWKTAENNLNTSVTGWNMLGNSESDAELLKAREYYIPSMVYNQTFSHRDYFFPIPQNEMQKNQNLKQNPGW